MRIAILGLVFSGCSCGDKEGGGDPCADVDCSGHGTCERDGALASCACEPDYLQEGLSCVEDPALHCAVEGDRDGDGDAIGACGGSDCDDRDPEVHVGAADEVGDGVDLDCDGADGVDGDGDAFGSEASGGDDCDDDAAGTHPGAVDELGDGVDQSCDGIDGTDADGDGHASTESGGDDCDDTDAATFTGATETPADGVDQNCDGIDGVDADLDGFASVATGGDDCDDGDASIHPDAPDDEIGAGWTVETAVSEGAVGWHPTLALDAGDAGWVVYNEPSAYGGSVHLATNASGAWADETVEVGGFQFGSLALDAGGDPHLVYGSYFLWSSAMRYASKSGDIWTFEDVDIGAVPSETSMALDADGNVHVAFVQGSPQNIGYIARIDGTWGAAVSIESGSPYSRASLALDADGAAHVCWGDLGTALHYATNAGGGGFVRTDDAVSGTSGGYCSIAIGADGLARVAHVEWGLGDDDDSVAVSTEGDPWTTSLVAADGWYDWTALALDADGNAHVAYRRIVDPASELWVATNESGAWVTQLVDDDVHTGYQPSIRVGADGIVRVAYYDDGTQDLRWAWNVVVDGIDQDCDGGDG